MIISFVLLAVLPAISEGALQQDISENLLVYSDMTNVFSNAGYARNPEYLSDFKRIESMRRPIR